MRRIALRETHAIDHETVNFGGIWHSDTVYLEQPPMATMLLARELPPYGGDTTTSRIFCGDQNADGSVPVSFSSGALRRK